MGCYNTKIKNDKHNIINVKFIHLTKSQKNYNSSNIKPEELNDIFGKNTPRFCCNDGSRYPYIFCVKSNFDYENIALEHGYVVGKIIDDSICETKFNSSYKIIHFYVKKEYYSLVLI